MCAAAAAFAPLGGCGGGGTEDGTHADLAQPLVASVIDAGEVDRLVQSDSEDVVVVDVECCSDDGGDLALNIAFGVQAAQDLPHSAPFVVRGADTELVATAARRLGELGYDTVYVSHR